MKQASELINQVFGLVIAMTSLRLAFEMGLEEVRHGDRRDEATLIIPSENAAGGQRISRRAGKKDGC